MADNRVTSDGEDKKKNCHYHKGKKLPKYSVHNKAKVIEMMEQRLVKL